MGVLEQQRRDLRARFEERLLELEPRTHLDVGAGAGELVATAAARGVRSVGLEPQAPGPDTRGPAGRRVRASADDLPLADGSVDWVTLRHVPHHLAHLPRALAEAWRVARRGLLIAEPWFDETRADQRFALRADRWLKRQDRRLGRFHADALSSEELRAALPGNPPAQVETFLPERPWTVEDLEDEAHRATADATLPEEERRELENLCEVARRGRMTLPGTLILTVRKG